jgi:hypothetical protein
VPASPTPPYLRSLSLAAALVALGLLAPARAAADGAPVYRNTPAGDVRFNATSTRVRTSDGRFGTRIVGVGRVSALRAGAVVAAAREAVGRRMERSGARAGDFGREYRGREMVREARQTVTTPWRTVSARGAADVRTARVTYARRGLRVVPVGATIRTETRQPVEGRPGQQYEATERTYHHATGRVTEQRSWGSTADRWIGGWSRREYDNDSREVAVTGGTHSLIRGESGM